MHVSGEEAGGFGGKNMFGQVNVGRLLNQMQKLHRFNAYYLF
jgi:hypothetical protein